jgi:hypothetical protein
MEREYLGHSVIKSGVRYAKQTCVRASADSDGETTVQPTPVRPRKPVFYVDVPTLIVSIAVGYPLGVAATSALTGQGALGGIIGIFVTMLGFGFIRRRGHARSERGGGFGGVRADPEKWS